MPSNSKLTVQIELKILGISPWENMHQRATSDDLSCSVNLCVSATVMLMMCYFFRLVLFLSCTGVTRIKISMHPLLEALGIQPQGHHTKAPECSSFL